MTNASKFDFTAWLETKDPDEKYQFSDGQGCCLMGQFMASQGEEWSFPRYNEYVNMVLGEEHGVAVLSTEPQSMGGALKRVKALEDA